MTEIKYPRPLHLLLRPSDIVAVGICVSIVLGLLAFTEQAERGHTLEQHIQECEK